MAGPRAPKADARAPRVARRGGPAADGGARRPRDRLSPAPRDRGAARTDARKETDAMAFDLAPFAERRRRFAEAIGDALAVIPAARETPRNADTGFEFRQDSDFYFLTGFDEPDAVAVVNPAHAKERFVLFVRPRDREMEVWNGRRAGVEGAVATYGADAAYTVDELDGKLREYAIDRTSAGVPPRQPAPRSADDPPPRGDARGARARLHHARPRRRPGAHRPRAAPPALARGAVAAAPRLRDQPRRPRRGHALRAAGAIRVRGPGRPRVRVQGARLAAQRLPVHRGLGPQRDDPALQREQPAHGGRRPPARSTPAASGAITPPTSRAPSP